MDDKTLLELAAKAAGYRIVFSECGECLILGPSDNGIERYDRIWSPLSDDGDALRLASARGIDIIFDDECQRTEAHYGVDEYGSSTWPHEDWATDKDSATRRAIVRAAAKIGGSTDA